MISELTSKMICWVVAENFKHFTCLGQGDGENLEKKSYEELRDSYWDVSPSQWEDSKHLSGRYR